MPNRVPGVYPTINDGGLGGIGLAGDGARVVVGVSSLGTVGLMYSITDPAQVPGLLGYGPRGR
jgi:hypothetical protein